MSTTTTDRNSLDFWFPPLEAAGLRVPPTRILRCEGLDALLDGAFPPGYPALCEGIRQAAEELGWPCFLRTGHGSGKHEWDATCHLATEEDIAGHVFNLVEWSHLVDMMGLPHDVWAVRELLPTAPLFHCRAFGGFPVTREFRLFVRDGQVEHLQPYWPPDAVGEGDPDRPDWRDVLATASVLNATTRTGLHLLAAEACRAVGGGYWSVDLLQDAPGRWWITDMAEGERSFRWDPDERTNP